MGIFSRFADIVNSNINSLLDSAEDPKKMIRLIIQEMEETLVEVRSSCARMIADKKELQRRVQRLEDDGENWEAKAKLAISKERDDLARAAIAEKSAIEEELGSVREEMQLIEDQLQGLNDEVAQLQVKLDDAKAQKKALELRAQASEERFKIKKQTRRQNLNDAFDKFEMYQRRVDELEGKVEAYDIGKKDLASEIDQLAKDDDINRELERLKSQLNNQ